MRNSHEILTFLKMFEKLNDEHRQSIKENQLQMEILLDMHNKAVEFEAKTAFQSKQQELKNVRKFL